MFFIMATRIFIFINLIFLVMFYKIASGTESNDNREIGWNPDVVGLNFQPTMDDSSNLIWIKTLNRNASDELNWINWSERMENFLDPYGVHRQSGRNHFFCSSSRPVPVDSLCVIDIRYLNCSKENSFGYNLGQPCVAIMMNRIFDFTPEAYNQNDQLPEDMPQFLQTKIRTSNLNMVWMTCEGEDAVDQENIGSINYMPEIGFPIYFFPDRNVTNYLSPLVMVQFLRPTRGVLINVECRAWAKNIEYNQIERRGSVHFELLID